MWVVWLGMDLQMDTKKDMCLKKVRLWAQNLLTILGSTWLGGPLWSFKEDEIIHFDDE